MDRPGSPTTRTAGADRRRVRSGDRFTNRDLLTQLPVPGKMLDTSTSHGDQDQVASRRVVSTRRVNRDSPGKVVHDRGQVLQRSWHGGTMDQGRPEHPQVDEDSCHSFKDNPMRLRLFTLAYNYSNFLPHQALFSNGETRVAHHAQVAACSRCKNPKSEPQIKKISTRRTPAASNCWNRKHFEPRAVLGET